MNPLELRYAIYTSLTVLLNTTWFKSCELVSPVPGEPVKLRIHTADPTGKPRVYTVSITED